MEWLRSLLSGRRQVERSSVVVDERGVTCRRPGGTVEAVAWADLRAVEILTTDEGPWSEDVFWVLHGRGGGCVVPQEAEGSNALLERLQQLPGFDNAAVIRAMGSTENARFPCWKAADA
jgi:hypothetical protein